MHFSLYLPDNLITRLNVLSHDRHINRSLLIRQVLEEWLQSQESHEWPLEFFSFDPIEETPLFDTFREQLTEPNEWALT